MLVTWQNHRASAPLIVPHQASATSLSTGDNFTNSIELQLSWQTNDNGSGLKDFFLSETNTQPNNKKNGLPIRTFQSPIFTHSATPRTGIKHSPSTCGTSLETFKPLKTTFFSLSPHTTGPSLSFASQLPVYINSDNLSLQLVAGSPLRTG